MLDVKVTKTKETLAVIIIRQKFSFFNMSKVPMKTGLSILVLTLWLFLRNWSFVLYDFKVK